jgi:hypothetical protein
MTNLQSQNFAKEVSSCFSAEAKARERTRHPGLLFFPMVQLDKMTDRSRRLRLMWKIFLELRADDLIAVGKQTQNAFTA